MIKPKISTKVTGQAAVDSLLKRLKSSGVSSAYVSIGFHEDAGRYPGANAPTVVEVALWNEYGTEKTPARSFIRSVLDQNEQKLNAWREEAIDNILFKGWDLRKALEMLGLRIQILIQNKIKSNVPPPLAESTMKAKLAAGRPASTLIDTTLMLRSVTYKVVIE